MEVFLDLGRLNLDGLAAGGDADLNRLGSLADDQASGAGASPLVEGDQRGAEALGAGELDLVGDGQAAGAFAGVGEGAVELLERLDVVGGTDVEDDGVGGVGELGLEHLGGGLAAGPLQGARHAGHGMAEGVEDVALVAARAEGAPRVVFGAGVHERGLAAEGGDERADVVVVVMLGIVAALDGDAQGVSGAGRGTADEAPCVGEPVAQRPGRRVGLGGGHRARGVREPEQAQLVQTCRGAGREQQAPPLDVAQAHADASAQEGHQAGTRSGLRIAVGKGGVDAWQDLHAAGELGDLPDLIVVEEVELSASGLADGFGQHGETAEAVAPVAEPLGAEACGREAAAEALDVLLGRGDEEGASLRALDHRQRRAGHAGQAHGVPVARGLQPPRARLAPGDHALEGPEHPPLELVADELPGGWAELGAEPVVGGGHVPGLGGGA